MSRDPWRAELQTHRINEYAHAELMDRHIREEHAPMERRIGWIERIIWMVTGGLTLLGVIAGSNFIVLHK